MCLYVPPINVSAAFTSVFERPPKCKCYIYLSCKQMANQPWPRGFGSWGGRLPVKHRQRDDACKPNVSRSKRNRLVLVCWGPKPQISLGLFRSVAVPYRADFNHIPKELIINIFETQSFMKRGVFQLPSTISVEMCHLLSPRVECELALHQLGIITCWVQV